MVPLAHPSPQPKENLDQLSCFWRADYRDRLADRPRDRQTTLLSL